MLATLRAIPGLSDYQPDGDYAALVHLERLSELLEEVEGAAYRDGYLDGITAAGAAAPTPAPTPPPVELPPPENLTLAVLDELRRDDRKALALSEIINQAKQRQK